MKGYNTIKEFVEDYKVYVTVTKVDKDNRGCEGLTLKKVWKERMGSRLKNATKKFKSMMSKNGYTLDDLRLIAVNDILERTTYLEDVIRYAYDAKRINARLLKKFLKSKALQNGRLDRLSGVLPARIKTQKELRSFIVRYGNDLHQTELKVLLDAIASKEWEKWLEELIESGEFVCKWGKITV